LNDLIPKHFKKSEAYLAAVEATKEIMQSNRFNLFQSSPIICRGSSCPYFDTCIIKERVDIKEIVGMRCPYELGLASSLSEKYVNHFLPEREDGDNFEADPIMLDLIKELVDYEVQINRAERIMSDKGHFLDEIVTGISPQGQIISNLEVARWVEYKNNLTEKKHKTMQLLNSTPKDRTGSEKGITNFASYLEELKEKQRLSEAIDISDKEEDKKDGLESDS